MNRFFGSAVIAGAIALAACSTPSSTELVVVVASDYRPGDEIARVVVTTRDDAGAVVATRDFAVAAVAEAGSVTIPFSFGVSPSGDAGRPLRLEVAAYEMGATDPFVVRRAVAPFVVGERRRLAIYLERACEQVTCDDTASTCIAGSCASANVPIASLDRITPDSELVVDGGTSTHDAGRAAACADDPLCDGARRVEVGNGFGCAIRRASGRAVCWGSSAALGQLGNGATTSSNEPVTVTGVVDAADLALGDAFGCAFSETQLWCWGRDSLGQLGAGDAQSAASPVMVSLIPARIFTTADTACASGTDGTCWGAGVAGVTLTLADTCGETPCARRPATQPSLDGLSSIADEGHTCAVRLSELACAGTNASGEVGDGTRDAREMLTVVPGLATVWSVATTARTTCAIDATTPPQDMDPVPVVHCWGAGELGQLATSPPDRCGDAPCALSPLVVAGVDGALELAATGDTVCARTGSGAVRCWGSDEHGELGDGVGSPDRCTTIDGRSVPCALAPTTVRNVDAIDLDARAGTFCVALRDGGIACWGAGYGELPRRLGPLPS